MIDKEQKEVPMSRLAIQARLNEIEAYFQALSIHKNMPLHRKLDPRLFSPDNETLAQCLAQALTTLQIVQQACETEQDQALTAFYAEKLTAQYHVLQELTSDNRTFYQTKASGKEAERNQQAHEVHRLPPPQRLAKYYEFLTRFNDLIAEQYTQLLACEISEKSARQQKIATLEQRKQRCQAAIDHLEEYLAFVEARQKKSAVF
ncbi:hypothetical protein FHQ27_06130 [Testudinibacter sp. TR-2022]|nr:hypothetical protein FHQ30_11300 [Pasteurellaceae bacterium Phil11]TNH21739.1 hypothetical protein FHQ29_09290 [Testudinibacter sp. TR-2022]TNH27000.1 hypothetical protein FHQ27_06130 [Testudinibacter sp. TR-2022]